LGAIADFDKALALKPDDPDALNDRGVAHLARGDLEHAFTDFSRAILLQPDCEAYSNRGLVRQSQGDLKHALEDYLEALRLKPDDTRVIGLRDAALKAISERSKT
jgi:tetratricopeptide (TPR) repeat protein